MIDKVECSYDGNINSLILIDTQSCCNNIHGILENEKLIQRLNLHNSVTNLTFEIFFLSCRIMIGLIWIELFQMY